MKKANTIGADKYFHAKGNYEAAKRGTGGKHAAAIIRSNRLVYFIIIFFYLGFTARQDYFWISHFEPSRSDGEETGDSREKPLDHPQAELGLFHMWPEPGSNPQRWDDERFRALKISVLNHSATGGGGGGHSLVYWSILYYEGHSVNANCLDTLFADMIGKNDMHASRELTFVLNNNIKHCYMTEENPVSWSVKSLCLT